jgi:O-antigen/teichoic acid export membrane protein
MASVLVGVAFFAPDMILQDANSAHQEKYFVFFLIVAAQTFVTFTGTMFECFLEGFQQYNLRNYATVFMSVVGAMAMYTLLKNGGGLITIAAVNAVGYSVKYAFYGIVLSSRRFGGFRFRRADISLATLKAMFSFGFNNLIYAISLKISSVTDSLIIGTFLGPAIVTLYIIPYNFISQARTFIWALSRNFMPLFSELDARGEAETAQQLYYRASRFMVGLILPLVIGIVMLGPSFLEHWMGMEYAEKGKIVLYIIAAAYGVQWLNPLANRFLTGYGQHRIMAKFGIAGSLFNLGLSLIFVHFFGKEGVALGTLLSVLTFEPLYLYNVCKILKINVAGYAKKVLSPLLIPVGLIIGVIKGCQVLYPPTSVLHVLLIATFAMILYLLAFFLFSMTHVERKFVQMKVRLKSI